MVGFFRDSAKFLAGVAANETLGHWWLGIWGSDLLPLKIGGFTFTRTHNLFAMIGWPATLVILVYFGWIYRRTSNASEPGSQALQPV